MNIRKIIFIITIIFILATSITICGAVAIVNDVSAIINEAPVAVNDIPAIVTNVSAMGDMDFDESYIPLYSKPAIYMAGERRTIPRRASSYGISVDKLRKPIFSTLSNDEVKERLMTYGPMLLGEKAIQRDVKDNGSTLALDMESGIAWIAKDTGAFELKTHDGKKGSTIVKNADHAVNLALEQIAESGILKLSENETLDVVSVTSTHYAGWIEKDGRLEPVYFDDNTGGEPVIQFKSEYTVNFGRRYRSIPVIGPPLSVKLDAEGRMTAFRKGWRDIVGEEEMPAEILSEREIEARRNPDLAKEHDLKRIMCGYVEGPSIGYCQESPGIGCHYVYYNPDNEEDLAGELDEWINISTEDSGSLIGERVRHLSGPQTPIEGNDIDSESKVTTVRMKIPKGWSMISLPVKPDNRSAGKLFPGASVIYGYEKRVGYTCVEGEKELEFGKGYWILMDGEKTYTITGQEIQRYTLPVNADGWYMIGGCTFPAKVSINNGTIITIYKYIPGRSYKRLLESEGLEQGKGYWILVSDIHDQAEISVYTGKPYYYPDLFMLRWPVSGQDTKDWVINNYVDLDPNSGKEDYMGSTGSDAKVYNNHMGIDIDVATFRAMDNDAVYALAAAAGEVTHAYDSYYDRHTWCKNHDWNSVVITHPNGMRTIYGHLKKDSILVTENQIVQAGEMLGVLGSSGCSTQPHLHFEIRDKDNNVIDPFLENMWISPPVYDTPLGFMDATLCKGPILTVDQIKDPPPNVTMMHPGEILGVGLSMAGGGPGDTIEIIIHDGNGSLFKHEKVTFNKVYRHRFLGAKLKDLEDWNYEISDAVGTWTVQILVNNTLVKVYNFDVSYSPGTWFSRHHVAEADYQGVFDNFFSKGFRPIWVDGYNVNGKVYYNAIFLFDNSGIKWQARHGLSAEEYQAFFDTCMAEGYRLLNVDNYRKGFSILYAAIFVKQPGTPQVAYHGVPAAQHQSQFDILKKQGYRPVNISVVSIFGVQFFTAFYDKDNVGSFLTYSGLTSSQYQAEFDKQKEAGRRLQYLNGFNDNGVVKFSAIWHSSGSGSWAARHNLSSSEYQNEFDHWTSEGMTLRFVTGYQNGNSANFAAFWSE